MTKIKHVFLFDDLDGTNKNHLSFRGVKKRDIEPSKGGVGCHLDLWAGSFVGGDGCWWAGSFVVVGTGDKNQGVGWVWSTIVMMTMMMMMMMMMMSISESLMFLKKAYSVRLQPLKVRWCARHHPLKGLEMIFFPNQNVKDFWRVFGTSAPFVTAYPTGGATQHFFLALLSWAENLGISKKRKTTAGSHWCRFFLGNGGMCVWSFVFQHIYVFWKEGG